MKPHENGQYVAWMHRALALAKKGEYLTAPNPMVGCLVVDESDQIISEGYHEKFGGPHAEVNCIDALKTLGDGGRNATMVVTLEPCCHQGKTPPCTDTIIKAGIKKIIVAMKDPNPKVAGKGIEALEKAGIEVEIGICAEAAKKLNERFVKQMADSLPWVTLKAAITLDGFIAAPAGNEKWISGAESRKAAHELRASHQAILVGLGTILSDNPKLTCRLEDHEVRQPTKIILDSQLKSPLDSHIFEPPSPLFFSEIGKDGFDVVTYPKDVEDSTQRLRFVLEELKRRELHSVLIEGGQKIYRSFLQAGLVDKLVLFVAPIILGQGHNNENIHIFGDLDIDKLEDAFTLHSLSAIHCGQDLRLEVYPQSK